MAKTATNYARQTAPIPASTRPTAKQVAAQLRALAQQLDPLPTPNAQPARPRASYVAKPPQQLRFKCSCCTHGNCPCPCHRGPL